MTKHSYNLDIGLKSGLAQGSLANPSARRKARLSLKQAFQARYKTATNRWFFQKLRF